MAEDLGPCWWRSIDIADEVLYLGWKCCKPRVLTFEEFLDIAPCTTGKHSTVDETPTEEPAKPTEDTAAAAAAAARPPTKTVTAEPPKPAAAPVAPVPAPAPASTPVPDEPESDDPSLEIPANATCRRKGCTESYHPGGSRDEETCVHHPGHPVFHEGSKGWSCCKRRVLEFDQFLKIEGCQTKKRHLFVGKGKPAGEEKVESVR